LVFKGLGMVGFLKGYFHGFIFPDWESFYFRLVRENRGRDFWENPLVRFKGYFSLTLRILHSG